MAVESIFNFLSENFGFLAILFVLFGVIYALSSLFYSSKQGRNPFSAKHVRSPPERLVIDPKARNAVLKQSKYIGAV